MGNIVGGIVGGVVGFFMAGPAGAIAGFATGYAGMGILTAMMPDTPTPGDPNPEIQTMKSEIGLVLPELEGTAKITGQLLCFGKERNEKVYAEQASDKKGKGGKGGSSSPQVIGFRYYMSWAVGIAACPGDTNIKELFSIYKNEDSEAVWSGELECPASGGQETIAISDVGTVEFYFGTNDQIANTKVGEIISDSTLNTPYRNMCWAFFDDCYIGAYNRTPSYHFIVQKITEFPFSETTAMIGSYDVNPANVLYYILSNMSGLPTSWLDSTDFGAIASTLSTESRGVSVNFGKQQSVLGYIEAINVHVDNIIRYGSDGKFHPKLIRDDYTVGSLPTIDESVLLDDPSFSRGSWIDTVNEVRVQFSEIIWTGIGFNIYGVYSVDSEMFGVFWDGVELTFTAKYSPGVDINGLIFYGDYLLTVAQQGSSAAVHTISKTDIVAGEYQNVDIYTPFNAYDVPDGSTIDLINGSADDEYIITDNSGRIVSLTSHVKQARNFIGSVVTGSDGNDYYNKKGGQNSEPISGISWSLYWASVGDNTSNDVPLWSSSADYQCLGDNFPTLDGNNLYVSTWEAPTSRLRRLDVSSDYSIEDYISPSYPRRSVILGDYLYVMSGLSSTTVDKYDKSPLSFVDSSVTTAGRFGDICAVGGFIFVTTQQDTGNYGVYKIDPDDLDIVDQNINSGIEYGRIAAIGDSQVVLSGVNYVSILDINTMEFLDTINLGSVMDGNSTRDLIVEEL